MGLQGHKAQLLVLTVVSDRQIRSCAPSVQDLLIWGDRDSGPGIGVWGGVVK